MKIEGTIIYDCRVTKSNIHGKGVFSETTIGARRKIGSLAGDIKPKVAANIPESSRPVIFAVELDDNRILDCSAFKNPLCHINHSCTPNCYLRILNHHVEVYALRKIKKGEEMTVDYGETHHNGTRRCTCNTPGCTRYL